MYFTNVYIYTIRSSVCYTCLTLKFANQTLCFSVKLDNNYYMNLHYIGILQSIYIKYSLNSLPSEFIHPLMYENSSTVSGTARNWLAVDAQKLFENKEKYTESVQLVIQLGWTHWLWRLLKIHNYNLTIHTSYN